MGSNPPSFAWNPNRHTGSRRLFFALWPDTQVRRGLYVLQSELSCHRFKATHPEDMHVTLAFLGDVEAEQQACVEAVADQVVAPAFDFTIDQLGFWSRPRILWCGPTHTPDPLNVLVRDLWAGLQGCGFEPERRPYAVHVTLARKARSARFREVEKPFPWQAREFVLVASRMGGAPPRYEVLRRWALG